MPRPSRVQLKNIVERLRLLNMCSLAVREGTLIPKEHRSNICSAILISVSSLLRVFHHMDVKYYPEEDSINIALHQERHQYVPSWIITQPKPTYISSDYTANKLSSIVKTLRDPSTVQARLPEGLLDLVFLLSGASEAELAIVVSSLVPVSSVSWRKGVVAMLAPIVLAGLSGVDRWKCKLTKQRPYWSFPDLGNEYTVAPP